MRKEYARLRRRPLLTPVWLSVLAGLCTLAIVVWALGVASTTLIVLVPAGSAVEAADAARAATILRAYGAGGGGPGPEVLLAGPSEAARQLAAPLGAQLGLAVVPLTDGPAAALASRVLAGHRGQRLFIVTDPSTLPALARALSGSDQPVAGDRALVLALPRFSRAALVELGRP